MEANPSPSAAPAGFGLMTHGNNAKSAQLVGDTLPKMSGTTMRAPCDEVAPSNWGSRCPEHSRPRGHTSIGWSNRTHQPGNDSESVQFSTTACRSSVCHDSQHMSNGMLGDPGLNILDCSPGNQFQPYFACLISLESI